MIERITRWMAMLLVTAMLAVAANAAEAPEGKAKAKAKAKAQPSAKAKALSPEAKAKIQAAMKAKAKAKPTPKPVATPVPTAANVAYGTDPKQVLDFWKAPGEGPKPLLFFIHGGGWMNGDKSNVASNGLKECLAAGISVVSVEYRFVQAAQAAGVKPPVSWPLHDAARALQFVRSKAGEWGIDKKRIGASGGSAGACSSLWLAFHDDMADPKSEDPIARESTRLYCAAVIGPQTSLDPKQMKEWIPNSGYGGHAFGFFKDGRGDFQAFLAGRESILPWIKKYSPYELVSADDPPIYMVFGAPPPPAGELAKDPTHSAQFGLGLKKKLDEVGVENEIAWPGAPNVKHAKAYEYLIDKLKK